MGFCFGVVFYGQLLFSRPAAIRHFCRRKIKCIANFKTMRKTITDERVKTNLINLFQFSMKKHSGLYSLHEVVKEVKLKILMTNEPWFVRIFRHFRQSTNTSYFCNRYYTIVVFLNFLQSPQSCPRSFADCIVFCVSINY